MSNVRARESKVNIGLGMLLTGTGGQEQFGRNNQKKDSGLVDQKQLGVLWTKKRVAGATWKERVVGSFVNEKRSERNQSGL